MPIAGNAKLWALGVAAAGLVAVSATACDTTAGPAAGAHDGARQVTVVGSGQVQGVPDTLTADVAMEFTAPDVSGALNQSSQRQQAVIDALTGSGIDRKDISTTQVSVQPQFTDSTISGYRASNAVKVKIRDTAKASQTLALIASTGGDATRINSVDYSITDDSDLVRDARARAFDDAKNRAEQYAGLSGLDLGKVISISEQPGGSTPPPPTPMPRAAMQAVPLEPGQQTVDFSVTVIWELT
ncbi:SIMPL domain-containing protein [Mycolicibacterium fortuitum]|uniref:SIMPL domain-containing protein n=1 Tax=Mycolicibacterium fortuitum TaxID=1766 RepID=UPI001AEF66C2|nr:SIMPL domain-containing protein [Mycolicibacterium fortuitum]MBP3084572.1 SIMPL domain-containing protein [Mycolicibacterium fortuitum]